MVSVRPDGRRQTTTDPRQWFVGQVDVKLTYILHPRGEQEVSRTDYDPMDVDEYPRLVERESRPPCHYEERSDEVTCHGPGFDGSSGSGLLRPATLRSRSSQ
jgi:hypothetical protein